jgi:hypothetical protein
VLHEQGLKQRILDPLPILILSRQEVAENVKPLFEAEGAFIFPSYIVLPFGRDVVTIESYFEVLPTRFHAELVQVQFLITRCRFDVPPVRR